LERKATFEDLNTNSFDFYHKLRQFDIKSPSVLKIKDYKNELSKCIQQGL
jgi:hypothetical protein